ncbi:hypothetical protein RIF29_11013 [Crotalaria pallida]|uniref:Trehalase n=1 Tax=Crotalaria pallida TaxID=3830 RepID=A0AAN9FTF8_CROPI
MWNKPRPELSIMFYCDLASAAESGWDFSTRWMRDPPDFTTLATTFVIHVDLNAFLLGETQAWEAPHHKQNVFAVVESLKTSGLIRAAGIATSLTDSGQQWDFPNGWALLQHMLVEGLVKTWLKEVRSLLGEEISIKWITTNYIVYKKTGVMHEKFDVEHCGEFGGGGEYVPQSRNYSYGMDWHARANDLYPCGLQHFAYYPPRILCRQSS